MQLIEKQIYRKKNIHFVIARSIRLPSRAIEQMICKCFPMSVTFAAWYLVSCRDPAKQRKRVII